MMEPKTRTTLRELQPGDRFYFQSDITRKVWQIKAKGTEKKQWKAPGGIMKSVDIQLEDDQGQKKWSQSHTQVVFLRHTSYVPLPAASATKY